MYIETLEKDVGITVRRVKNICENDNSKIIIKKNNYIRPIKHYGCSRPDGEWEDK